MAVLASAGSAFALQGLPAGGQVNDDAAAGINPALSVGTEDPANADVVGGALTAGKVAVPWAVFRQTTTGADQIFSRSFAGGAWTTRGVGTVGGSSSAAPTFTGSLNFDQTTDGEAPAIDFAGAGRTVPWATWYEKTAAFAGKEQIFASRFDNAGDANQGKWIFSGQDRGPGTGAVSVPSLNLHTGQDAENPSVAGGTTAPGNNPGPWITWQETSTANGKNQIFVVKPVGPGSANCNGVHPLGVGATVTAIGGFCWQQTGAERFGTGTPDPSLNVDPARDGIEPDIAFTGASDAVPWVVWYETGTQGAGLQGPNGMVFAAKAVTDTGAGVDGGFHWEAHGNNGFGALDTSAGGLGTCSDTLAHEAGCSLNISSTADAEDPRVASGTMNPANPTVPWVAWDEDVSGHHQVFVSRLVGAGTAARFVPVNGGQPISTAAQLSGQDATRPDITFSGNTPYVTWRTDSGATSTTTVGHFVNAADPTFVVDKSGIPITSTATADVREPIASGCTANPFNADGATCQGGALGTPFFLFTNGTTTQSLFADAHQPDAPVTGASSGVGQTTATVSGTVNPEGARTSVSFQFGTTTAYGQTTAPATTGPDNAADAVSAALTGLPVGTTIHYRAVATNDFGTQVGADQTLTTQSPPAPVAGKASVGHARVSGKTVSVPITCTGDTSCKVSLKLTVIETHRGHKLIAVSARKAKLTHKTVVLGTASATIKAGRKATVHISLNGTGRHLLAARHTVTAKLAVVQSRRTILRQKVTFKAPKHHVKHGGH
ncbi:MAG TPA: hypothetical protein VHV28_18005 [Solirubrobacteraceae bacterium]|nr:hypothetical protein [Solirubrobacteraceae bacterium]